MATILGYQIGQPSTLITIRYVTLFVGAYWIATIIYYLLFHPLRKVPGPLLARVSETWRNIRYFRGTWHEDTLALHNRYGGVVRIAPNEISFVDEKGLKALYGHGKQIKKVGIPSSKTIVQIIVAYKDRNRQTGMTPGMFRV